MRAPCLPESWQPILGQVIDGLEAAHRQGILHRDLKPSNIMLCGDRAVIMDFGLAVLEQRVGDEGATFPASTLGTPAYMSPEQLEGRKATPASDVYSLGIVLYEMLTGHAPHRGLSPLAIAARRVQEPPPRPSAANPPAPARWDAVVAGCLSLRPSDRIDLAGLRRALSSSAGWSRMRLDRPLRRRVLRVLAVSPLLAGGFWLVTKRFARAREPSAEAAHWYSLGAEALGQGSSFAATRLLERAVEVDGDFPLARIRLAEALLDQDFYERAKDQLLRADLAIRQIWFPPDHWQRRSAAAKALALRDFPSAIRAYEDLAAGADDEKLAALLSLAATLRKAEQWQRARDVLQTASAIDRQSAGVWLQIGIVEAQVGKRDEAVEAFRNAESIFELQRNLEGLVDSQRRRALALMGSRNTEETRRELETAFRRARELKSPALEAQVLFAQARLEQQAGDSRKTIQTAEAAIAVAEGNQLNDLATQGLIELAQSWGSGFEMKTAQDLLRKAIRRATETRASFLAARAKATLAKSLMNATAAEDIEQLIAEAEMYFNTNQYWRDLIDLKTWANFYFTAEARYQEVRQRALEEAAAARRLGDRRLELIARTHIAEVEDRSGNCPEAVRLYRALAQEFDSLAYHEYSANQYVNGAAAAARAGDIAAAEQMLELAATTIKTKMGGSGGIVPLYHLTTAEKDLSKADYGAAEANTLTALRLNANRSELRAALANSILARCLIAKGRAAEGLALARSIAETKWRPKFVRAVVVRRYVESLVAADRSALARARIDETLPTLRNEGHRQEAAVLMVLGGAAQGGAAIGLDDVRTLWGDAALKRLLSTPDLLQLMKKGRIS